MAIGAKNYVILTVNDGTDIQSAETAITFDQVVPTTGYPFMLVVSTPFEILQADSQASTYVINVTRRQEGTTNTADILDGAQIVCELTHEALDDVYGELLTAQKKISDNETTASRTGRTPDVNEITLDTDLNKMFIGVDGTPNTWEELCLQSHADLDDLSTSISHTQYYTDTRGNAWHTALSDEHLDTLDHDHFTVPAANMRDLAVEPVDTITGGVYYNKTNYSIYYYDGAAWKQYSTVPKDAIIFRDDGVCPSGWTEKTAWNGYYLKGETVSIWAGGSGGSLTHTHDLTDVPQHAHTNPARSITVTAVGDHSHSYAAVIYSGSGSKATKFSDKSGTSGSSTVPDHTHTLTVPQHNSANAGTSGAKSQATTNEPKYVELTICEKD